MIASELLQRANERSDVTEKIDGYFQEKSTKTSLVRIGRRSGSTGMKEAMGTKKV